MTSHVSSDYYFCCQAQWLESFMAAALRKKNGEEKQFISSKLYINDFQPLVCFALCTGALSDPVVIFFYLLFSKNCSFDINSKMLC